MRQDQRRVGDVMDGAAPDPVLAALAADIDGPPLPSAFLAADALMYAGSCIVSAVTGEPRDAQTLYLHASHIADDAAGPGTELAAILGAVLDYASSVMAGRTEGAAP